MPITAAGLSAAGNFLSGAGALGGLFGGGDSGSKTLARKQYRLQDKIAHQGIRMRVADAKAAGIHPLYALGAGAPQASATPIMAGNSSRDWAGALTAAGDAIAREGSRRSANARQAALDAQAKRVTDSQIAANAAAANLRNTQAADIVFDNLRASRTARAYQNANSRQSGLTTIELPSGRDMGVGPGSPARDWEDEYGGLSAEITGGYRALRDTGKYLGREVYKAPRYKWNAAKKTAHDYLFKPGHAASKVYKYWRKKFQ